MRRAREFSQPTKPMRCACGHDLVSVEQQIALWKRGCAEDWSGERLLQELDTIFQAAPHPPSAEEPKP